MPADSELTSEVAQAEGMISVQADCTVTEALDLMKNRAAVMGLRLLDIADATIKHRIFFGPSS